MTTATPLAQQLRARERTAPLHLVGLDAGNATALLADGAQIIQIPSYIGSGSLADLLATRGGAGGAAALLPGEVAIEHAGQLFFVGDLALSQSRDASSARADTARYANGHTLRLLMALVGIAYGGDVRLRIVTGVPPAVMKAQPQIGTQIAESLLGTHYYVFHDLHGRHEIALTIETVAVVMECVATLAALGEPGKPIGVLDIGGHTVDISWFDARGRVVDSRTDSLLGAGVDRVGEILSQQFRSQYGRALRPDEIQQLFQAYLAGEATTIYHRGPRVISADQVHRAIGTVAATINTFLGQRWGGGDGGVAADGAYVLLVGGGARFFPPFIQLDAPVRQSPRPEQDNAQSYAQFAQRIQQRGTWPQPGR
ncbi:MAG TPA: ParM/StbA family protein [Kouleothrix sp.]|nr:ParM/StbA family protein [Kouleothrix sp.]